MTPSIPAATRRRPGPAYLAILVAVFAAGAGLGAYWDWVHWNAYSGASLLLSLGAVLLLLMGGLLSAFTHRLRRRVGLVVLALGVGLLAGQFLGPSREPLILQTGGKMTIHMTSPVIAMASGPATCENVASGTEFEVSNDYTVTRLDSPDQAFILIEADKGARWEALSEESRKDGVRLTIRIEGTVVPASGKPLANELQAGPSSTLTSTFSNAGGSIMFANLVPRSASDLAGEPIDIAGTVDWTCGTTVN